MKHFFLQTFSGKLFCGVVIWALLNMACAVYMHHVYQQNVRQHHVLTALENIDLLAGLLEKNTVEVLQNKAGETQLNFQYYSIIFLGLQKHIRILETNQGNHKVDEMVGQEMIARWKELIRLWLQLETRQGYEATVQMAELLAGFHEMYMKCTFMQGQYRMHQAISQKGLQLGYLWFFAWNILAIALFWYVMKVRYLKSFKKLHTWAKAIGEGDSMQKPGQLPDQEFAVLAEHLSALQKNQSEITLFAQKVGQGDFTASLVAARQRDMLSGSLLEMKEKLENLMTQERKRNWLNEGFAYFSEILQNRHEDIHKLSELLISRLVQYVGANQGALFIGHEKNESQQLVSKKKLYMAACYAGDRHRYAQKEIYFGDTLPGQAARDGNTLLVTDIPDGAYTVLSGTGMGKPKSLLVVPLVFNETVQGVIELAAFNVFEPHEVEFVEKLAEHIAATFSSVRANTNTIKLLESSMNLTEQLTYQEEQMRQNMEELQATQEEMLRKENELSGILASINNTLAMVEYDMEGRIIQANQNFLKIMGYSLAEIKGKKDQHFIVRGSYDRFWRDLNQGKHREGDFQWGAKNGQKIWLSSTYTPILNRAGKAYKIINIAQDITEKKQSELQAYRLSLVANNTDNAVIITDKHGLIEYVNEGFTRMTGYTFDEIESKKPGSFLQGPDTNRQTIASIREHLRIRKPSYHEILNYSKSGESYWVSIVINPVFNKIGQLEKFISIQANITETKKAALGFSGKMDAIDKAYIVLEFDRAGNLKAANKNYGSLLGEHAEVPLGTRFTALFANFAQSPSEVWEALLAGQAYSGDFCLNLGALGQKWVRGSLNVIFDIKEQPSSIVVMCQDISHEKALEEEAKQQAEELRAQQEELLNYTHQLEVMKNSLANKLEQAREEIRVQMRDIEAEKLKNEAILENSPDGIISINQIGIIDFFNKAACHFLGQERMACIGSPLSTLLPIQLEKQEGLVRFSNSETGNEIPVNRKMLLQWNPIHNGSIHLYITITETKVGKFPYFTIFLQPAEITAP
jgi:PAS domain S-box-containing protein